MSERRCYDGCSQLFSGYCYAHSRGGNIVLEDDTPMCGFNKDQLDLLFKNRVKAMCGDLSPIKQLNKE